MQSFNAYPPSSSEDDEDDEEDFLHPSVDPAAEDLEEFNPRKRRRTGRNTKEGAALGVFGEESDSDEAGPRWKRKKLRGKGIVFVGDGGEEHQEGESETDEVEDEEKEDEDIEDATRAKSTASSRGLGLSAIKGLAWQTPGVISNGFGSSSNSPLGRGFVPSSAAIPVLGTLGDEELTPKILRPSAFSAPAKGDKKNSMPVNAGSFAARMMAKMGYKEGQGLGKEGQGRSGVIEVQLRPQGVGLGAVKEKSKQEREEEKRQAKLRGEVIEDSEEERKRRKSKSRTSHVGSGVSTPRKSKRPQFRTVEEIRKAAPGLYIPEAFAPILDMTAPQQRLLTSTSGLLTPTTSENLKSVQRDERTDDRKLARRAQNELVAFVEEWKSLEERKAYIDMEILQQRQEMDEYNKDLHQLTTFARIVEGITDASNEGQWDPVIKALTTAEFLDVSGGVHNELSSIAVSAVHPFLRQFTEGWQPLEDPKLNGMATSLFEIRHVLGATSDHQALTAPYVLNERHQKNTKTTPYDSMIYRILFPKIVSAINQSWDVHNPTPLLVLLEAWNPLLPSFVRSQILDHALVNKLNAAVSSWNPRKRRPHELPHLWLFPWLQYLPSNHADPSSSSGLVSDVKRKFRHLIDVWDYRKGIITGLAQWKEVLQPHAGKDHWTPLIMNHVLPSMSRFLKNADNFQVDPNDQSPYMSSLTGILSWSEKSILKPGMVAQVMADTIFPMWQDVLYQWLTVVGPNEEIGQWFEWWRDEVFPETINTLSVIKAEFQKGHDMINHALDLGDDVATHLPAPSRTAEEASLPKTAAERKQTSSLPIASVAAEISFRQTVEDWCIENDLQFLPDKKALHAAGPLYRITAAANGKLGVLVFFRADGVWAVQRRGRVGEEGTDIRIDWDSDEGRDVLLGLAWQGVK